MRRGALAVFASLFWCYAGADSQKACPKPQRNSRPGDGGTGVTFTNESPEDLLIMWVDDSGQEIEVDQIGVDQTTFHNTQKGHVFRFYTTEHGEKKLMPLEYQVEKDNEHIKIEGCAGMKKKDLAAGRSDEFATLVHDQSAACNPPGRSDLWSCVRHVTKEERAARKPEDFGFADKNEAGHRQAHDTKDQGYTAHRMQVPRLTKGRGILKMNFTDRLRDMLLDWYAASKKDGSMEVHEEIGGGYTNIKQHPFDKINLDKKPKIHAGIVSEMHSILQWWTQLPLLHTATFGVRIYRREAMLVNHVDRADTHLASAVMQIGQECDPNGGWPLEVEDEDGELFEVYLQPGEMVLYEGAHLFHGRPMRFRGSEFGNVFTHYKPQKWYGPGRSPDFVPVVEQPTIGRVEI
eukprot:TRINITY_DN111685_c0_g1_i1.p1 TRINITY_DN111685_c0_g1~~TRINITY_DN111685_c0_g1_i1.p1  ORF type:complete len:405 (-),score=91.12 TRINITY_DN111685_c0_g1_i1:349-1563(-)